jgi:hypothetical protein
MCRSLISSFGTSINLRREGRYPEGKRPYTVTVGVDVTLAKGADPRGALSAARRTMAPAGDLHLKAWLAKLQAGCARRPGSEATAAVQLNLYTEELRKFPADVAKEACQRLLRGPGMGTVWFPTLGELIAVCEALVTDRAMIIAKLEALVAEPPPELKLERYVPSPEDRKLVSAMWREYDGEHQAQKAIEEAARVTPPGVHAMVNERGVSAELLARIRGDDGGH